MSFRDYYIKMDQVKKVESRMQDNKQGGKYSQSDTYLPGSSSWYESDDIDTSPESTNTSKKVLVAPNFDMFSDEEDPISTDNPFIENKTDQNVTLNSLFLDKSESSPSQSFSPIGLDFAVKEEPDENNEPMTMTDTQFQEDGDLLALPFLDIGDNLPETSFKNLNDGLKNIDEFSSETDELSKSAKKKKKKKKKLKKPYELKEKKLIEKNVLEEQDNLIHEILPEIKPNTELSMSNTKNRDERDGTEHLKITGDYKTTPDIASDEMKGDGQTESPMDTTDTKSNKKRPRDNIDDITDITSKPSTSKKSNTKLNVDFNQPKDVQYIENNRIIKMEHFYSTREDCYKRYRDMLGIDIRRRKYVDKFKRREILEVEWKAKTEAPEEKTEKLKNVYKNIITKDKLEKALLECMMNPTDSITTTIIIKTKS